MQLIDLILETLKSAQKPLSQGEFYELLVRNKSIRISMISSFVQEILYPANP